MKKHIALLFLSLGFFTACDMVSGEGEGADNAVYMGNTNSSGVISMVAANNAKIDMGGNPTVSTNGWKWWKYKTAEGTESYIDDYRL